MPAEGQPAPHFTLPDQDGQPVSLADFRGRPVILYFYPKDATPGCTTEACDFRDASPALKELGAVVLGISPDDAKSHKKFAEKQSLNFPILADPEKSAIEAYGVWKEKSMYGKKMMGVERTTFVIGPDGTIRKVFAKVKVDGHSAKAIEAVKGLN